MRAIYAIIFDTIDDSSNFTNFEETIRSYYISKKAKHNVFFVIAANSSSKIIFDNLQSKFNFIPSIMVVRLGEFYGSFDDSAIKWMHEQFPDLPWED